MKITEKVHRFVLGIIEGKSQSDAYRGAYNCVNMKPETISRSAVKLMKEATVIALIEKIRQPAQERVITKAADVMEEMLRIHSVDTTEIVKYRRLCCRFCHGEDHKYQWKHPLEFAEAMEVFERLSTGRSKAAMRQRESGRPTDEGGYGFRGNAAPAADCPNCYGEGTPDVYIADFRTLTPIQRKAIAGVKQTKDGIEIKFRDQDGSLKNAGAMMGGFKQTVVLENPDGSPINSPKRDAPPLPADPLEATQVYSAFIKGSANK